MSIQAKWGPLLFVVSTSKITSLSDLTTNFSLKTDVNEDTSEASSTNTKGRELQKVSFMVRYLRAAGIDPREQMENWGAQLGNSYPLYVGGRIFGPSSLQLESIDVSSIQLSNNGEILSCDIMVSFLESTEVTRTTTTSTAKTSNSEAMNATASASEKSTKKVSIQRDMTNSVVWRLEM